MMSVFRVLRYIASHPLNRGRRLAAIVSYVRWQVGSRLIPGAAVYEWVGGSRFLVRAGETGLTGNMYTGLQEFEEMAFLLHVLRGEDLFVDVGANLGSYTILACAAAGARGCCFEPVPATFARLLENIRINHLEQRVQCHNTGVGNGVGVVRFSSDMGVGNRVLTGQVQRAGAIEVPVATLDELVEGQSPTVIKIDVEGYETAVLQGAARTLRQPSLQAVIMEVNGSGAEYGFDEARLFVTMADHGFAPYTYVPMDRALVELLPGAVFPENILFVRDRRYVQDRLTSAPAFTVQGRSL